MKTNLTLALIMLAFAGSVAGQKNCSSAAYNQKQLANDPGLQKTAQDIEDFIKNNLARSDNRTTVTVITVPVVIHVLYHQSSENISDAKIMTQIESLNRCFRRTSADTVNTPARFKMLAADCEIQFRLASSDPRRKSTNGIVRKYTPIAKWEADDKIKFSSEMGDDAWDPHSYLNIWVGNLGQVMGYSSVMGGPESKDGIVIGYNVFGTVQVMTGFDQGKTGVHEVGHWLGLQHLWGDAYCGDDGVGDTPKQAGYNMECPTDIRISCGNGPNGDMYMNYMDFTNDRCMNLFTLGQKARMRAVFSPGGVRNSILSSKGLDAPLIFEAPLPVEDPRWLHPQLYPIPAAQEMTLDLAYDIRWIGKTLNVYNMDGQTMMRVVVTAKSQKIDISKLQPGMYILLSEKEDKEMLRIKFMKL
jgi:hypothetical protein